LSSSGGAESGWFRLFDDLGFGQWLRCLTGIFQVGGARLVLIRPTFYAGILLLASTMIGAMVACVFFLGSPGSAIVPGVLLVGIVVVASLQYSRRDASDRLSCLSGARSGDLPE
jgi:hypothetical protein